MGTLEIVLGDITKQDVDVIVNAAHESMMGGGGVDGAIHRAAGQGLLRECMTLKEKDPGVRCRIGETVVTSGHMLKAKWIIHTVAPRFAGSMSVGPNGPTYKATTPIEADLRKCYVESMRAASALGARTIAFPSLGTGGHSIPVEVAAGVAVSAIKGELSVLPNVELVRIVCFFESDMDEYKWALAARRLSDSEKAKILDVFVKEHGEVSKCLSKGVKWEECKHCDLSVGYICETCAAFGIVSHVARINKAYREQTS